jgi:hypothetical protein
MFAVRILVCVAGLAVVVGTLSSAIRTMVVPRGIPTIIVRVVFVGLRQVFRAAVHRASDYVVRDRRMAYYAPLGLLSLPVVWLFLVLLGYTGIYWGIEQDGLRAAFRLSGSSLLTLGFASDHSLPATVAVFTEAALGIGLLALLISYLPAIYGTFSRREAEVGLLETKAGNPPWGVTMLIRYTRIDWPGGFDVTWRDWQHWFVEVEESHVSMPALTFFRSPQPDRSWVTAAGAVLDGASLIVSCFEGKPDPEAQILIRTGYITLRRLADYYGIEHDPDPKPGDPISIAKDEFDAAWTQMAEAGVTLRADREEAWRAFRGWRVNYDTCLLALAGLVEAPPAPWSSDRSPAYRRPRIIQRRRRRHG